MFMTLENYTLAELPQSGGPLECQVYPRMDSATGQHNQLREGRKKISEEKRRSVPKVIMRRRNDWLRS